jgi:hypothetical protein
VSAFAAPTFNSLTEAEFTDISKEMAGNFMHHSVQGAAPLGDIFGFEVGIVGGQQSAPKLGAAIERSGGSGFSNLYHAGILGVVSVPFGITGEVMIMPKTSASDADFQLTSLALKLSLNSLIPAVLPVNFALRCVQSTSKFSFKQSSGGVDSSIENETKVSGLQLLIAPSIPIVEPYAGIGYLTGKNTLSASAGSIFDPSYSTGQSMDHSESATQFILGVTANLLVFHVGAEYSNAFGASTYTGKLAFGF